MAPQPGTASSATTTGPPASQTRNNTRRQNGTSDGTALSSSDLFKQYTDEIQDATKAHEVLAARFLVPPNMPPAVEHLLAGILSLARAKPGAAVAVQSLVALHHYAKAAYETELAKGVADAVAKKLDVQVGEAIKVATSEARKKMEDMVKGMQEQAMETRRSMGEAVAGAGKLLDEVKDVVAGGVAGTTQEGESPVSGPRTYAQSAMGARGPMMSPHCARAVRRAQLKQRQILVDGLIEEGGEPLTAAVLVAKAHMALNMMQDSGGVTLPEGLRVLAASVLPNGGVVYEFDSANSAAWVKRDGNMLDFQRGLGVGAQVKARFHKVVAEFVPVSFNPEDTYDMVTVERDNDIEPGNLVAARWIKPQDKRAPGQRVAFLMLSFLTAQDANRAVTNGLYIASKHVSVRRDMEEPQRCAKCHKYDPPHLARNCKAIHETCATCASIHHKTADCTIVNPDEFRCVNCGSARGHAAWDRCCPAYQKALTKLRARRPESGF